MNDKNNKFTFIHFIISLALIAPKIYGIDVPLLILLFPVLFFTLKIKTNKHLTKDYFRIFGLWIMLLVLSLFSFVIVGSVDIQFILKPFRQIVLLTFFSIITINTTISRISAFQIIIVAALINCLVIFLQLLGHNYFDSPNFLLPEAFDETVNVSFRKPGLMSGYPHAGLLSLIALQCLVFFVKRIKRFSFVILLTILTLSLIVTSRTALMLSIFPYITLIFMSVRSKKALSKISFFLFFGIALMIYVLNKLPEDTFKHSFEIFLNLSENNSFSTSSSDATIESFQGTDDIQTWLWGNGKFMRNDSNLNVDDGIQIPFYGGGIFYLSITLLLYFLYFNLSIKNVPNLFQKYTISIIFLVIFISNFKVDTIFTRVLSDIATMFVTIGLVYNSERNKLEKTLSS